MTKRDLERWVKNASWHMLAEFTVAGTAASSPHGRELALKWIDSKHELIASAGWATLSGIVATKPDAELDLAELKRLLKRIEQTIHQQPNYVRYTMNGFVIAAGCYVAKLTDLAMKTGEKIGEVHVDMGETACQVPTAPMYIQKVKDRGTIGKKRKSAKC